MTSVGPARDRVAIRLTDRAPSVTAKGSIDVAEGEFGAAQRPEQGQDLQLPEPGDRVEVISGRNRGSSGVLEEIETLPTPSGSTVKVGRVKRPRSTIWEFPHLLRRIET